MNVNDAAYIAGLFDGEGCVTCKQKPTKRHDRDGKVYNQWYIRCEISMTDTEFMNKHPDIGPFDLVFFDGPHMTKDVMTQAIWFANRSREGTRFIFDDYTTYAMDQIAFCLTYFGFKTIEAGENKICLEKKS